MPRFASPADVPDTGASNISRIHTDSLLHFLPAANLDDSIHCYEKRNKYFRLPEIRRSRRTCPANFQNVRRRAAVKFNQISGEKLQMSGEAEKVFGKPGISKTSGALNAKLAGFLNPKPMKVAVYVTVDQWP